jgi:hypothetical protein
VNPLARAIIRGAAAPAAFTYDDIPDQLLRINSLEGSLAFSGAVLTGVTDVSGAGETVTVTGSPVYTASDAGLNGAPSFTIAASSSVIAPNVNRASIRFWATVFYRPATTAYYAIDADEASTRYYVFLGASANVATSSKTFTGVGSEPVAGRKRLLFPNDNATNCTWNGTSLGTQPVGSASGNGITFGAENTGGSRGLRTAFSMLCSSVPSAPLLAAIEAKLITDFG